MNPQTRWDAIEHQAQVDAITQHAQVCSAELVLMQTYQYADEADDEILIALLDPIMEQLEAIIEHLQKRIK